MPQHVSTGQIAIVDVNDGLSAQLSLNSVVLPADAAGNVNSYTSAETTFTIFEAGKDTSSLWGFYISAIGAGITYRDVNDTANRSDIGPTNGVLDSNFVRVTSLTQALSWIDITATKAGQQSIVRRFSVARANTGATGTRGTLSVARAISGGAWVNADAATAISGAGGGSPIRGDIVTLYRTSPAYSETRTFDGTNWVSQAAYLAGSQIIEGSVNASKLIAGSIQSGHIAANTIATSRLAIANFDNYATNGEFTMGNVGWGGLIVTNDATNAIQGTNVLVLPAAPPPAAAQRYTANDNRFAVKPGDSFVLEWAGKATSDMDGSFNVHLRVNRPDGSQITTYGVGSITSAITAYTVRSGVITIPADGHTAYIQMSYNNSVGTGYIGYVRLRKRNAGELIVDGTITGNKVAANTISSTSLLVGDTTNYAENANFQAGSVGWVWGNGGSIVEDATNAYNGGKFVGRFAPTNLQAYRNNAVMTVAPGDELYGYAMLKTSDGAGGNAYARITFINAANVEIANPGSAAIVTQTAYARSEVTATAPAGAVGARIEIVANMGSTGKVLYIGAAGLLRRANGKLLVDGAIETKHLTAKSITANELAVGDFTNLAVNGDFSEDMSSWDGGAGIDVRENASIGYNGSAFFMNRTPQTFAWYSWNQNVFAVQAGDEFWFEWAGRSTGGDYAGQHYGVIQWRDTAGASLGEEAAGPAITPSDAGWKVRARALKAPANAAFARVGTLFANTAGNACVGFVGVRRRNTANLIVDGTITGLKIASDAIEGKHIKGETITGDLIKAGEIVGDHLEAGTIKAAQIGAGEIIASKLAIGNTDNIIPDGDIQDAEWWTGKRAGTSLQPQNGAWTFRNAVRFDAGFNADYVTPFFPVEVGATYKISVGLYASPDFAGRFNPVIHLPNAGWYSLRSGSNWPTEPNVANATHGVTAGEIISEHSFTHTNPTGIPNNNNRQWQFRFHGNITAGYIEFMVKIVRVGDGTLIKDGSITTNKIVAEGIAADVITTGTMDAARIKAGTVLAGSITVGGSPLSTAHSSSTWTGTTGRPTTLAGLNNSEGTKLSGIAAGATVGATWGTNVGGRPSNLAGLAGSESIKNADQLWSDVSGAGKPETYTVSARGNATTNLPAGFAHGVRDSAGNVIVDSLDTANLRSDRYARSYSVVWKYDGVNWAIRHFDVYGNGTASHGSAGGYANNATGMAQCLNEIGAGYPVIIYTSDEPMNNRLTGGLPAAIYRCGGSKAVFASSAWTTHSSYVLMGQGGIGEGNGKELFSAGGANSYVRDSFSIVNGVMTSGGQSVKDAKDIVFSDGRALDLLKDVEAGATAGANWATNVAGKPTNLSGINSAEGTKLGGIAAGATVGAPAGTNVGSTAATTVESRANNPAARINEATTNIAPGRITIQGGTTLDSWRDQTEIRGGAIKANSITAEKLDINSRGINFEGVDFQVQFMNGWWELTWSSGYVQYVNDAGTGVAIQIAAGNTVGVTKRCFIYWVKGEGQLRAGTQAEPIMANPDQVMIGTYMGGTTFNAYYGSTIIHGDQISTGSINANRIQAGTVISNLVQVENTGLGASFDLGAAMLAAHNPAARINSGSTTIDGGKITTGSIVAGSIKAGEIEADKLKINTLTANQLNFGATGRTSIYCHTSDWYSEPVAQWKSYSGVGLVNEQGSPMRVDWNASAQSLSGYEAPCLVRVVRVEDGHVVYGPVPVGISPNGTLVSGFTFDSAPTGHRRQYDVQIYSNSSVNIKIMFRTMEVHEKARNRFDEIQLYAPSGVGPGQGAGGGGQINGDTIGGGGTGGSTGNTPYASGGSGGGGRGGLGNKTQIP